MKEDLFPADAGDDLPPAMRRALAKLDSAEVVAAFEICGLLSPIFRHPDAAPGTDTMGGATRFFFGVEFDNDSRRYFAGLAGLRDDAPTIPPGLLPREEAVAKARRAWAQHLLRCIEAAALVLETLAQRKDNAPRG